MYKSCFWRMLNLLGFLTLPLSFGPIRPCRKGCVGKSLGPSGYHISESEHFFNRLVTQCSLLLKLHYLLQTVQMMTCLLDLECLLKSEMLCLCPLNLHIHEISFIGDELNLSVLLQKCKVSILLLTPLCFLNMNF